MSQEASKTTPMDFFFFWGGGGDKMYYGPIWDFTVYKQFSLSRNGEYRYMLYVKQIFS